MGLFDDAIREHLDLKRRHGADPADIVRAEQEALGPVRRGSSEPAEAVVDHQLEAEQDLAYEEEEEEGYYEEPFAAEEEAFAAEEDAFATEEELEADEAARGGHLDYEEQESHERSRQSSPYDREEDLEEPDAIGEPARPPEGRPPTARSEQETAEHEVPKERPKRGDDALEQRTEFLEDHDRFWFDERTSRDFDFDK